MAEQRLSQIADRLEKVATRLESVSVRGGGAAGGGANGELFLFYNLE